MSEELRNVEQKHNSSESLNHSERVQNTTERELTKNEKEHGSTEQLEKLQQLVEKKAVSKSEFTRSDTEIQSQHPVLIRKDIKEVQFHRTMTRVRKKLSAPSRIFSKVIHTSTIDKSSEFIGKTVARPSGLLAGAVLAFIGTSALLWITRYYGYEYNYLLVIVLFIAGMAIGLLAEGLWRLLRKNKES